jgi:hypothetical protein
MANLASIKAAKLEKKRHLYELYATKVRPAEEARIMKKKNRPIQPPPSPAGVNKAKSALDAL